MIIKNKKLKEKLALVGLFVAPFIPLFVANSLFFPYITGKAFLFRILVEILLALWLVWWATDREAAPRRSGVVWGVLGLTVVTTLATIFGVDPYRSFWSNFERMDGLISLWHLGVYFFLLIATLRTEKQWRWWLGTSLLVSALVVFLAVVEYAKLEPGVSARLATTFGNPIYLAVYLLLHFFIGALFLAWTKLRGLRLAVSLLMLGQLWALYQTATRSAILGLVAGLIITLVLTAWRVKEYPRLRLGSGIALGVIVLLGGAFWSMRDSEFVQAQPVLSRFANISLQEGTTQHRLLNWGIALEGFRERPLLGWGPENYVTVFAKHFDPRLYDAEPWFDRTHNIFLDWLVSAGLLGLLSYLSLYGISLYYLWRENSSFARVEQVIFTSLLAAYLVHNFFVFDSLTSYLVFFALLAYFHVRSVAGAKVKEIEGGSKKWRWGLAFGGIVVIGAGLYFVNFVPWRINRSLIAGLSSSSPNQRLEHLGFAAAASGLGRLEGNEQLISDALRLVRHPEIPEDFKIILVLAVREHLSSAVVERPGDVRLALFYGSFLRVTGDFDGALVQLSRARDLAPRKQTILFELAQAYKWAGKREDALEVAEVAYQLAPDFSEAKKFYESMLAEAN